MNMLRAKRKCQGNITYKLGEDDVEKDIVYSRLISFKTAEKESA